MQEFAAGKFHFEPSSRFTSLDHLVGALLKEQRHVEAKRLGGLEIDGQLELGRLLDRKVRRRGPLEDAINIRGRTANNIDRVRSVRHQAAFRDKLPKSVRSEERRV